MIIALKITNADSEENALKWTECLARLHGSKVAIFREEGTRTTLPPSAATLIEYRNHYNHFPQDDNALFQEIAAYARDVAQESFLYVESDATPLCADWLARIQAQYEVAKAQGFAFMGDLVSINGMADSLAPIGVYPRSLIHTGAGEAMLAHDQPWTLFIPKDKVYKTPLIRHAWEETTPESLGNECVLVHPDRDGRFNLSPSHLTQNTQAPSEVENLNGLETPLSGVATGARGEPVTAVSFCSAAPNSHARTLLEREMSVPYEATMGHGLELQAPTFDPALYEEPWADKERSLAEIDRLAAQLKLYCDCPARTGMVRARLKKAKVIK